MQVTDESTQCPTSGIVMPVRGIGFIITSCVKRSWNVDGVPSPTIKAYLRDNHERSQAV